jgi:hypothetical protein
MSSIYDIEMHISIAFRGINDATGLELHGVVGGKLAGSIEVALDEMFYLHFEQLVCIWWRAPGWIAGFHGDERHSFIVNEVCYRIVSWYEKGLT